MDLPAHKLLQQGDPFDFAQGRLFPPPEERLRLIA